MSPPYSQLCPKCTFPLSFTSSCSQHSRLTLSLCTFLWNFLRKPVSFCGTVTFKTITLSSEHTNGHSLTNTIRKHATEWSIGTKILSVWHAKIGPTLYTKWGHASVCSLCRRKLRKKEYYKCIICGSQNDTVETFYHKSEPFIFNFPQFYHLRTLLIISTFENVLYVLIGYKK